MAFALQRALGMHHTDPARILLLDGYASHVELRKMVAKRYGRHDGGRQLRDRAKSRLMRDVVAEIVAFDASKA